LSEKAVKNYILALEYWPMPILYNSSILNWFYKYKFVKPVCVLNMLTSILLITNTCFWTVALTNISP